MHVYSISTQGRHMTISVVPCPHYIPSFPTISITYCDGLLIKRCRNGKLIVVLSFVKHENVRFKDTIVRILNTS